MEDKGIRLWTNYANMIPSHTHYAVWHVGRLRRIATSVGSGPASELWFHSSAPGVSWSSSLALSFRYPVKGYASDVVLLSPHDVPNPSLSPSHDDVLHAVFIAPGE